MKKNLKTLAFLTAFILLSATSAFAEDTIFDAVNHKVVDILLNLQQVIYIIGGFGLIAFAFAAVFGKISFRHLSYLSFSLFLVATMGLFVREITGDENAMKSLNYTDYCESHDCSEDYVAPDDCDDCEQPNCKGIECDKNNSSNTNNSSNKSSNSNNETGDNHCQELENAIDNAINDPAQFQKAMQRYLAECMSNNVPGTPNVSSSNTLSLWDQIQGIINDVNHGINTVQTLYGVGVGTANTIQGVVHGIQNAGDGFGGAMNTMNAIGTGLSNLGGLAGTAGGAVFSWMNNPNAQNTYNGIASIIGNSGRTINGVGYTGSAASNAIGNSNGHVGGGINAAGIIGNGINNAFNGARGIANTANGLRP